MSRITILTPDLTAIETINGVVAANRTEKLNGENTLSFSTLLKCVDATAINTANVVGLDGDYFDIAEYKKEQQTDGKLLLSVTCEHVSYRLNNAEYNKEYFAETGSPSYILSRILEGTGFTINAVEFVDNVTYSIKEGKSRRGILMEFASHIDGEVYFHGFEVSILQHRGKTEPTPLLVGKNITLVSKTVNKHEADENGNPLTVYSCGLYGPLDVALGDFVTMDYDSLDINITLRIVSLSTDPYDSRIISIEVGNGVQTLEKDIYRIETTKLSSGKLYYGARISGENGFESIRSDNKARAVFNADLFAMQVWDEVQSGWKDKLYFDSATSKYVFDGELSASLISALEAEFDVTISNTVIVNQLSADKGNIAELTVDRLDTSDKVQNYLASNTGDVNYIRIADQTVEFVAASTAGTSIEQIEDRNGNPVFWLDDTHTGTTLEVTDYPVLTYVYIEDIKAKITFEDIDGVYTPKIILGAGWYTEGGELREQAQIYKGIDGLVVTHTGPGGKEALLKLNSYVDATMRRISNVSINKTAGTIAVTAEGESSPTTISYTETDTSMTFTWPDSHSATISIN